MLLLFAAGIMNLVWIAGLAILVLVEKLAPFGARLAPITAALLIGAGVYVGVGLKCEGPGRMSGPLLKLAGGLISASRTRPPGSAPCGRDRARPTAPGCG